MAIVACLRKSLRLVRHTCDFTYRALLAHNIESRYHCEHVCVT